MKFPVGFPFFRRLRCVRNRIHINLFCAIIIRGICHFLQIVNLETTWLCKAITVLNTYTIEATYSWVFVEALFLHNTVLVHVMNESSISLAVYISIGWGIPGRAVIVFSEQRSKLP
ncbi:Mitochondrial class B secretin G-protein coupled receptor [Fasciolopsis buskii]|uniref:Mitochondrial class B secretin G-protein coupled receptor n=1 Tax=Fasciolopsis buskii TaxID=27845 RepID=A0A8E0RMP2_9TREM|nr:Mitochondrial class B secretin G-protein coupled receptor [Fasciolopsis buski]